MLFRSGIRVQPDFFVVVDSLKERLTILERLDPQRWISVYYEPSEDPYELSKAWMLERRAEISDPYYDGDYVTDKIDLTVREVDFCGFPAIQLTGVWQNDSKSRPAGGPFRSYGFYDSNAQRLYLVDIAVFAPGKKKLPYLRQLDVMARTFRTQNQK